MAQMLPNAVTAPGEPRGQAGWGSGIPRSSCPGRRVSSFQAEGRIRPPSQVPVPRERAWQDPDPLSCSGRMASSCLLAAWENSWELCAAAWPGSLKPEWPLQNPSSLLPPPTAPSATIFLQGPPSVLSKPPVRATTERVTSIWEGLRTEGILCPWSPHLCRAPCQAPHKRTVSAPNSLGSPGKLRLREASCLMNSTAG